MENLAQLKELLTYPKDIVIISHRNPDGDAIGSSMALYYYLKRSLGHSVTVMVPSEYPVNLGWIPDTDKILIHDIDTEACDNKVKKADIIFCLDFNSLDRIDKLGKVVEGVKAHKVMIDHHLFPDPFPDFVLSDTSASSTCELVYDFIEMLGDAGKIDPDMAEAMYTGILTDTGSFKYAISPKLFRIVAQLLEKGVDDLKLQDLIFNSLKEKNLRLLGYCLDQTMEILPEYKTGIITLTKEDYAHFDIKRGDTEGIVNYLLKMRDIKLAAFITEQPTIVKLSLRSKGDFNVQEIMKKHFRGGGHKNAAGGASFKGLRYTLRKFKGLLPEYKEELNK
ncbi:MAG: bifunctional oligoribonuclease/PAP phosphatase NrnA [Saprospiraceae bacterium]